MPSRICGTVIAGAHFFPPPSLAYQEPRGDERENLMVMPAASSTNFVMRQPRLALAPFDRLLDAMGRQSDAGELLGGRSAPSVREIEVVLRRALIVGRTDDHERLVVLHDALVDLGPDAARRDLDFQGAFVSVADVDPRPGVAAPGVAPLVDALEVPLGKGAAAVVCGRRRVEIAEEHVAGHGQQIWLVAKKCYLDVD